MQSFDFDKEDFEKEFGIGEQHDQNFESLSNDSDSQGSSVQKIDGQYDVFDQTFDLLVDESLNDNAAFRALKEDDCIQQDLKKSKFEVEYDDMLVQSGQEDVQESTANNDKVEQSQSAGQEHQTQTTSQNFDVPDYLEDNDQLSQAFEDIAQELKGLFDEDQTQEFAQTQESSHNVPQELEHYSDEIFEEKTQDLFEEDNTNPWEGNQSYFGGVAQAEEQEQLHSSNTYSQSYEGQQSNDSQTYEHEDSQYSYKSGYNDSIDDNSNEPVFGSLEWLMQQQEDQKRTTWQEDMQDALQKVVMQESQQIEPCRVVLYKNGGQGGTSFVKVKPNQIMPQAKSPHKVGVVFTGFFDQRVGGKQYYDAFMNPLSIWDKGKNDLLYAQWQEIEQ